LIFGRQSGELRAHRDASIDMWSQLLAGAAVSFVNFAIHAIITAAIVLATPRG